MNQSLKDLNTMLNYWHKYESPKVRKVIEYWQKNELPKVRFIFQNHVDSQLRQLYK